VGWLGCLIGLLPGCALAPWNSFLDPTAVGQFPFTKYREGGIRRVLTPREAPPGLANATEPTPEDLVPLYEDYRIGPNVINDLIAPGVPEQGVFEVQPTGYIRLAILGPIKITGMTELEVEQELKARLIDDGLLPDPIVRVMVQTPRQRFFTILGAVNAQAAFPITQPDLRLLDALAMARGIGATTKTLYVIRRDEPGVPETMPGPTEQPAAQPEREFVIPPPMEEEQENSSLGFFAGLGVPSQEVPASQSQQSQELEELETIITPPGQATQPATQPEEPERQRPFPPLIFDPVTGEPRELPPGQQVEAPPPAEVPIQAPVELPEF
jgi:protein involved in polysaccharide export with SLBB domain